MHTYTNNSQWLLVGFVIKSGLVEVGVIDLFDDLQHLADGNGFVCKRTKWKQSND